MQRDTTAMRQMRERIQAISLSVAKSSTTTSDSALVRDLFDKSLLLISDAGEPEPNFFSFFIFFGAVVVAWALLFVGVFIFGGVFAGDVLAIGGVIEYVRVIDFEIDFWREDPSLRGSVSRENIVMDRVVLEAAQVLKR